MTKNKYTYNVSYDIPIYTEKGIIYKWRLINVNYN